MPLEITLLLDIKLFFKYSIQIKFPIKLSKNIQKESKSESIFILHISYLMVSSVFINFDRFFKLKTFDFFSLLMLYYTFLIIIYIHCFQNFI